MLNTLWVDIVQGKFIFPNLKIFLNSIDILHVVSRVAAITDKNKEQKKYSIPVTVWV